MYRWGVFEVREYSNETIKDAQTTGEMNNSFFSLCSKVTSRDAPYVIMKVVISY